MERRTRYPFLLSFYLGAVKTLLLDNYHKRPHLTADCWPHLMAPMGQHPILSCRKTAVGNNEKEAWMNFCNEDKVSKGDRSKGNVN